MLKSEKTLRKINKYHDLCYSKLTQNLFAYILYHGMSVPVTYFLILKLVFRLFKSYELQTFILKTSSIVTEILNCVFSYQVQYLTYIVNFLRHLVNLLVGGNRRHEDSYRQQFVPVLHEVMYRHQTLPCMHTWS